MAGRVHTVAVAPATDDVESATVTAAGAPATLRGLHVSLRSPLFVVLVSVFLHSLSFALVLTPLTDLVADKVYGGQLQQAALFISGLEGMMAAMQFIFDRTNHIKLAHRASHSCPLAQGSLALSLSCSMPCVLCSDHGSFVGQSPHRSQAVPALVVRAVQPGVSGQISLPDVVDHRHRVRARAAERGSSAQARAYAGRTARM